MRILGTYNQNGNVTAADGMTYAYHAENHMISASGNGKVITMVYDAFGNRVSKTVNGVTTRYLIEDDVNPTGLPQVISTKPCPRTVPKRLGHHCHWARLRLLQGSFSLCLSISLKYRSLVW